MGTVIPLKKEINNSYLELKNLAGSKLEDVSDLINIKLASEINLIQKMTDHHLNSGGKRIRPLLTLAASKLCGYKGGSRDVNLAACVELIHSATLLHDDVIDGSDLRRGNKTANSIWGNQSSILVGDYLFSRCFELMVSDSSPEILKLLSSTSSKIAQGEVLQLEHKGEIDVLEETYFNIINMKTAALFAAAARVGACITNKSKKEKDALESYGKNIGLAFQIADDALDYYATQKIFGKEIGKDFFEGKATLPLIIIFQKSNNEEKVFLKEVFKKEKRNEDDFSEVLALINKYKAVQESFKKAEYFVNTAQGALEVFEDSLEKKVLQKLTQFSINRSF